MIRSLPNTVLMTADTVGGVWQYSLELSKALQQYDIEIHLATMGRKLTESQWKESKKISALTIHESDYKLEWMDEPWDEVDRAGGWLLELEQQIQPDLIHLNNYVHGNLSWNAPVLIVGHSCVLSWWQAVKGEPAPDEWNNYAWRVKQGLQQADYVVGVSYHMLNQLDNYYGPFSNFNFIHNARSAEDYRPGDKKPIIFSMGRLWDEAKNISQLAEIADQLDWRLFVAGESGEKPSDSENVTLLGQLPSDEVKQWLSEAGIYVMPARYEPFGLSVLEAALSGCALVLGAIPTLREIWGNDALYVNPDNPSELRAQIQYLINNDEKRKKLGRQARQRARYYSPDRFAARYIETYQKLLAGEKNKIGKKRKLKPTKKF